MAGSVDGEREPMVGSPAPIVTSATGAKTQVKPRPRSSMASASAAARTTARPGFSPAATASPAAAKAGKSVATPERWETSPPSWSTPTTGGKSRPSALTAASTAAVVARTCAASTTFSAVTDTPARWCSATRSAATSGSVPA
ncbi:hypothetical protein GCM10009719_24430 [Nocardioides kribbensis]